MRERGHSHSSDSGPPKEKTRQRDMEEKRRDNNQNLALDQTLTGGG